MCDTQDNVEECVSNDNNGEEDIDELTAQLTSREIDHLQLAIFDKDTAGIGASYLVAHPIPNISRINTVVLGNIFHAMDCAKIPSKHEAKKLTLSHYHRLGSLSEILTSSKT